MKYFLIVFDKKNRELLDEIEFSDSSSAMRARISREIEERGKTNIEVVVLGAANREALINTHSRYFGTGRELSAAS